MVDIEQRFKNGRIELKRMYKDNVGHERVVNYAWSEGCVHYIELWAISVLTHDKDLEDETRRFEVLYDSLNAISSYEDIRNNLSEVGVSFSDGLHITLPGSADLTLDSSNVVARFDNLEDAKDYIDDEMDTELDEEASLYQD